MQTKTNLLNGLLSTVYIYASLLSHDIVGDAEVLELLMKSVVRAETPLVSFSNTGINENLNKLAII